MNLSRVTVEAHLSLDALTATYQAPIPFFDRAIVFIREVPARLREKELDPTYAPVRN